MTQDTSGVLLADDVAMSDIEEALSIAKRSADDTALGLVQSAFGRWARAVR
jgi:hypothetical protein